MYFTISLTAALAAALTTFQPGLLTPVAATHSSPATLPSPVTGTVRDSAGNPLSDAQVIIPALNRATTTNDAGAFTFTGLPV
ncbi:MAG: carboxypeptidase-like regulatory domain-containing protein, partial [Gemmatimonadaceae bacterium]